MLQSGHVGERGRGRGRQARLQRVASLPAVPRAVAEIKLLKPVSFAELGKTKSSYIVDEVTCGCESKGDTFRVL